MRVMLRKTLLLVLLVWGLAARGLAADARISISGAEQQISGNWDNGPVTISFSDSQGHIFSETVGYGQFSRPASIASGFGAEFTRDFIHVGLGAQSVGPVIYFHMEGTGSFGPVTVTGSTASFQLDTSAWSANSNPVIALVCTPDNISVGNSTSCTASVAGGAAGTVAFSQDGSSTPFATPSLISGTASVSSVLSTATVGVHSISAVYSGDTSHTAFATVDISPVLGSLTTAPVYSYSITSYSPDSNVRGYVDTVNGIWTNISYDSLNRLSAATQTDFSQATQSFCWSYDGFGNRTLQASSNQPFANVAGTPCTLASGATMSSTTPALYTADGTTNTPDNGKNRLTGGAMGQFVYDNAGNITSDTRNNYLYDDEGRVCAVMSPDPLVGYFWTQYIYDAEGNRVAKGKITIPSYGCDVTQNGFTLTNTYALGPGGEQVTEMGRDGQWLHSNLYAGGQLLATYDDDGIHFQIADWLGSRRVQADDLGRVEETYPSLPFGEMLPQNNSAFLGATEQHF
ncbi:MAG: Ig-like domain-containing protein, partial [Acidobacteriota bacterium]|nr:Ig-like domain-containing protein [Acidobacteriota bacterium]